MDFDRTILSFAETIQSHGYYGLGSIDCEDMLKHSYKWHLRHRLVTNLILWKNGFITTVNYDLPEPMEFIDGRPSKWWNRGR